MSENQMIGFGVFSLVLSLMLFLTGMERANREFPHSSEVTHAMFTLSSYAFSVGLLLVGFPLWPFRRT